MKLIIANPALVIPWEHEAVWQHNKSLEERAFEEKEKPRARDEILADIQDYLSVSDAERRRRMLDRETKGWKYVPPVPVFEAPEDLLKIGLYVVCNGHNRLAAAKYAGILLPCLLLENGADMYIACRGYDDILVAADFALNRDYVWERARRQLGIKQAR